MRNLQTTRGNKSLEYEDLCVQPDIDLPIGYKLPKFDTFNGIGDPHTHLRAYCDKLVGVGRDERRLKTASMIQPIEGKIRSHSKMVCGSKRCAYHSSCWTATGLLWSQNKIEALIKEGAIQLILDLDLAADRGSSQHLICLYNSETPTIWGLEPEETLKNWTCTSSRFASLGRLSK
ncbi:hypothetical protein H5410_008217 [Solanum commersonii]|uniref:Uncharacterized protein n=1 Tax=Solanum commersonii TaxID=4109 RepID=A0A9J6AG69_SOLCO|nr:hypothetical protein H5410_008217 [Solanum commersonii]